MSISPEVEAKHREEARIAAELYTAGLAPDVSIAAWHTALSVARGEIVDTLRDTKCFVEVPAALTANARHARVLRALMAPPISQDQFAILCPAYSKTKENDGRAIPADKAAAISAALLAGRDRRLTRWLDRGGDPRPREIRVLVQSISPILGQQAMSTKRRGGMSADQEGAVVDLLLSKQWIRMQGTNLVETPGSLPPRHFLKKIRFATDDQPQEVDIACGLKKGVVLAMECKVTNDPTNSIKRINDILKKARAWQKHWASFVKTAALLQGVIEYKDVARLLGENVEVFWSHRLEDFEAWIDREAS